MWDLIYSLNGVKKGMYLTFALHVIDKIAAILTVSAQYLAETILFYKNVHQQRAVYIHTKPLFTSSQITYVCQFYRL